MQDLRLLFNQYDADHDGFLSTPEFLTLVSNFPIPVSQEGVSIITLAHSADDRYAFNDFRALHFMSKYSIGPMVSVLAGPISMLVQLKSMASMVPVAAVPLSKKCSLKVTVGQPEVKSKFTVGLALGKTSLLDQLRKELVIPEDPFICLKFKKEGGLENFGESISQLVEMGKALLTQFIGSMNPNWVDLIEGINIENTANGDGLTLTLRSSVLNFIADLFSIQNLFSAQLLVSLQSKVKFLQDIKNFGKGEIIKFDLNVTGQGLSGLMLFLEQMCMQNPQNAFWCEPLKLLLKLSGQVKLKDLSDLFGHQNKQAINEGIEAAKAASGSIDPSLPMIIDDLKSGKTGFKVGVSLGLLSLLIESQ